jgi:hypothetical protein
MDADQQAISQFLNTWPDQFVSRREICRRAGGKWRYREDEYWAIPVLQRMLEIGLVEADDTGHFRLAKRVPTDLSNKKKVWISPAIRTILKQSGRDFGVIDLDKEPERADHPPGSKSSIAYRPYPQEIQSRPTQPPG